MILQNRNDSGGRGGAEIVIRDTGIGINSQDLPHIFERFYRTDVARRRDGGGSGLGLSICHSIVKNHGGNRYSKRARKRDMCYYLAALLPALGAFDIALLG